MINDIFIPFELDVYEGLAECQGILYLKENSLVMEFQTKDSLFGVIKSKIKKINLSVRDIINVDYKKSIFKTRLSFFTKSLIVAEKFPGAQKGEISIKLQKKDREKCECLVSKLNLMIAEAKLEDIEGR